MKISCLQENLNWALGLVRNGLPTRVVLPATYDILLQTNQTRLVLTTTDLEVAVTVKIQAKIEEEGEVTVQSKNFINCIESFKQDLVSLKTTSKMINIECGKSKSRMATLPTDDYPIIPEVEGMNMSFKPGELTQILPLMFCYAKDDARPILAGVSIKSVNEKLMFATTDGFRMSLFKSDIPYVGPLDIVIPRKGLNIISKIITDQQEPVDCIFSENRIFMKQKNAEVIIQLLMGKFPDVTQVLPNPTTVYQLSASDLLTAVKAAMVFSKDENIVRMELGEKSIFVSSNVTEDFTGDSMTEVQAKRTSGETMKFAANGRFLLEVLTALGDIDIELKTTDASKPIVITRTSDDKFIHVIMPVIIQW